MTKAKSRRSSFRTFGAFLTSHMRKKFSLKKSEPKIPVDQDAVEAGFIAPQNNRSQDTLSETASLSSKIGLSALTDSFVPPGVCGLANHGNTCYINAIIQCLSNTDLIAEYFVMGQYKSDLKNVRKDRSKKYGTGGELAEQVAVLIRSLWTNHYDVSMTKRLKDIMCKHASQYKGNEQHDSQEFLLWVFDKVHEDLNILPVKKTSLLARASFRRRKKPQSFANASLQSQLDIIPTSFVQKVFQAHFRSTLTCPNCSKQSHTMDPSLCVSLPVSSRTTRPINVTVVRLPARKRGDRSKSGNRRVRIGIAAPLSGKIQDLRRLVAGECRIHSRLLLFVEFTESGFGQSYGDDDFIDKIPSESQIHAFEMPAPPKMSAGTLPRNFASRHKKRPSFGQSPSIPNNTGDEVSTPKSITIVSINKDETLSIVFGQPVIFHCPKDVKREELRALIVSKNSSIPKKENFVVRVGDRRIDREFEQPFTCPIVESELEKCPIGGPLHLKVIVEWKFDKAFTMETPTVEVEESVRLQRVLHQQPVTCTLQECFDLLTKPERLSPEDAWHCPFCEQQQQGLKKLSLSTLPDVLVVHLKRFTAFNDKRNKLNTRVEFPIVGLDMTPYLLESCRPKNGIVNGLSVFSSAKNKDCLYDLYAVCNHFGSLNSGHYTACCLNPLNGHWYRYDDNKTELISEENLSQQSAYILFYQRRSTNMMSPSGGGSVTSLSFSDHWSSSLLQNQGKKAASQSRLNEYDVRLNQTQIIPGRTTESVKANSNNNSNRALRNIESRAQQYPGNVDFQKKESMKRPQFVPHSLLPRQDDVTRGFVRGVSRQQSVPRYGSRREVENPRRVSERRRNRPSSQYADSCKRSSYF